jgi:hypothetical protein
MRGNTPCFRRRVRVLAHGPGRQSRHHRGPVCLVSTAQAPGGPRAVDSFTVSFSSLLFDFEKRPHKIKVYFLILLFLRMLCQLKYFKIINQTTPKMHNFIL